MCSLCYEPGQHSKESKQNNGKIKLKTCMKGTFWLSQVPLQRFCDEIQGRLEQHHALFQDCYTQPRTVESRVPQIDLNPAQTLFAQPYRQTQGTNAHIRLSRGYRIFPKARPHLLKCYRFKFRMMHGLLNYSKKPPHFSLT